MLSLIALFISCCIEINGGNKFCCNPEHSISLSLTYNKSSSPKDEARPVKISNDEDFSDFFYRRKKTRLVALDTARLKKEAAKKGDSPERILVADLVKELEKGSKNCNSMHNNYNIRKDKSANSNLAPNNKLHKLNKKILFTRKKEFKERIRERREEMAKVGYEVGILSYTPSSIHVSSGNLSDSSLLEDLTQNMSYPKKSNSLNIENKYVKLHSLNINDTKTNKNN